MRTGSEKLFERALGKIPGGVSSPVRSFGHVGGTPVYFSHAKGAYLYDVDGNSYVDYCASFGPHILGHCPERVVSALQNQAAKATSFGACHPGEVELAEWILKAYPFLDKVRLVNSGTEALMTAIRLARGYTKRSKILKFEGCYHGHSDGLLAKAGSGVASLSESSSKGVPDSVVSETLIARWDSPESWEAHFKKYGGEIAALVLEPIPANYGLLVPERNTLVTLMRLAREAGALVIFDEVITGFRVGLSGATGLFDLKPDLVTLGKIIGGGLPLAALAGRKEIMDELAPLGSVYQAGTLSGNPLATAAGIATLSALFESPPYSDLETKTRFFVEGLKAIISKNGLNFSVRSVGSLFWIHFGAPDSAFPPVISSEGAQRYASLFRYALEGGIYLAPSPYEVGFISTAHTQGILESTLNKLEAWVK